MALVKHAQKPDVFNSIAAIMDTPGLAQFAKDYLLHPGHRDATLMFMAFYLELRRIAPDAPAQDLAQLLQHSVRDGDVRQEMVRMYRDKGVEGCGQGLSLRAVSARIEQCAPRTKMLAEQ